MLQSFVSKLLEKNIRLTILSYRRYMGKTGGSVYYLFTRLHAAQLVFHAENCQHANQKQAHATIDFRFRHIINPRPTRFVSGKVNESRRRPRRYQVDPSSRGREVARGVLRSSPKPGKGSIFCHVRWIDNFCRLLSTHQRPNIFVSDAWPAPATCHRPSVEPLTSRPRSFHDAVVDFVGRCLFRTRNLAASN